jgi:hypothetical protein
MSVPQIGYSQEIYQLIVIISMILVIGLKTYGMYQIKKSQDPTIVFNYGYVISAVLGVFVGYTTFMPNMMYTGTYIDIFMQAGFYAIGANLLVDMAGKSIPGKSEIPKTE